MKKVITLLTCLVVCGLSYGKSVDLSTAQMTGYSFLAAKTQVKDVSDLQLVYTATATVNGATVTDFYVFNVASLNGFVMVSADDRITPVLAYSNTSSFRADNIPTNISGWLKNYEDQINYVINNNIPATQQTIDSWGALAQSKNSRSAAKTTIDAYVGPLLHTTWDQEAESPNQQATYNALCPFDNTYNELTVTGCVATATAQVMKYWNWPVTGIGSHTYNDPPYGSLSANFDSTTYQWSDMPNSISTPNTAIATLMYQVGVSVNMSYGTAETDGSGAYVLSQESPVANCTQYALKTYFGYKATLHGEERSNYPDEANWTTLLETEINAGRPVLYEGFGTIGGHNWVADGYDVTDNYMHFNWGWGGESNGYYSVDNLAPPALGTGAGSGNFNDGQAVLIGIEPDSLAVDTSIALHNNMRLTQNNIISDTVYQGQPISVAAVLNNIGTVNFYGDLDLSLYNVSDTSLAFPILQLTDRFLVANGNSTFTFPDSSFNATPGTYLMMLKYEETGDISFSRLPSANFPNPVLITVESAPVTTAVPQIGKSNTINIYPNPASDVVYIDMHNVNVPVAAIRIMDMQGREMETINATNTSVITVPVSTLATGLYFVELQTANGIITKKISIVR